MNSSASYTADGPPSVPESPEDMLNVDSTSLPTEILCDIFEFTATTSRVATLQLRLVSSWVKQIADPHLDAVLVTYYRRDAQLFKQILEAGPHNETTLSRAKSVRKLWLRASFRRKPAMDLQSPLFRSLLLSAPVLAGILHYFPNLEALAWAPVSQVELLGLDLMDVCHTLRLWGIAVLGSSRSMSRSIELSLAGFGQDLRDSDPHTAFDPVTHIRIDELGERRSTNQQPATFTFIDFLQSIPQYRNLTHLCIGPLAHLSVHLSVFRDREILKNLHMIVIEVQESFLGSESWMLFAARLREERSQDDRLFLHVRQNSLREDWESEAFGGRSLWDQARIFTSRIHSGEWQ
jgi:hypothetical protein